MIIDHGYKSVKMSLIRYRPDIREYQLLDKVKDMARSIEDVGLLHPIILRYGTKEVIAGHHRAAACLLLKKDTIKVHMLECSDVEAQYVSMIENAQRNHNSVEKDAAMEALVELHLEC
jgi:ParB/RepB/Spo0J family partition protein